jgi:hypothetical protein
MKKSILLVAAFALLPSVSMADNVGGCGLGSKLFAGKRGIAPQVLAVTTNGTFGNQTFGITSGTSGCTQDGVVTSNWKTAAFIDGNMNRLALDMSRGEGESLSAVAALIGVEEKDARAFNATMQKNFTTIFSSSEVTSTDVVAAMKKVLSEDNNLAVYSAKV